jgi:hypothetical protein
MKNNILYFRLISFLKNNSIVFIGVLFLIAISFPSCSTSEKKEPLLKKIPFSNPLDFEYSEIDAIFGECDTSFCYQVVINYPVLKNDSAVTIQQRIITDLVYWKAEPQTEEASLSKLVSEQESMYNDAVENELSMGQNWYLNLSAHIDFNNNGILSYTVTKDAFTGGAHPIYESILVSLSLGKEIKQLKWADLFEADRLVPLKEYVKMHFYEFHGLDYSKPVNDQGFWFESGEFDLNNNFSIQQDGIAVLYNHYEVAPYSTGPTSLFLPWADIKSWLKPEFSTLVK